MRRAGAPTPLKAARRSTSLVNPRFVEWRCDGGREAGPPGTSRVQLGEGARGRSGVVPGTTRGGGRQEAEVRLRSRRGHPFEPEPAVGHPFYTALKTFFVGMSRAIIVNYARFLRDIHRATFEIWGAR